MPDTDRGCRDAATGCGQTGGYPAGSGVGWVGIPFLTVKSTNYVNNHLLAPVMGGQMES